MGRLTPAARARRRLSIVLLAMGAAWCSGNAIAQPGDSHAGDFASVHARVITTRLRAYGRIEPIINVPVRAIAPGTLRDLRVARGAAVKAGDVIAHIGGPRMRSLVVSREQALHQAQAQAQAASRLLEITRHQLSLHLATRQAVDSAQAGAATARAQVETAGAQLEDARQSQDVRAPAAGVVADVAAANGEQVAAGQNLLTIQPADGLRIHAAYYGADADLIRVGMRGRFMLSSGGDPIPVEVVAVAPGIAADAGRYVDLISTRHTPPPQWVSGRWGTVTLDGPTSREVMVPTVAL
ncbi:MAG: efflux RND transporter periplasmic adaptor subunit, partial [Candidimonas sp.]